MKRLRSPAPLAVLLLLLLCPSPPASAGDAAQPAYTILDLGTLGGSTAEALAINNTGQIVGRSTTKPDPDGSGGTYHAFLYDAGRMKDLGLLPGSVSSAATGINDDGVIVGKSTSVAGCFITDHPFRYADGQMTPLQLTGANHVGPVSVNRAGHYAGWCNINGRIHAFLHDGRRLTDLGALDGNPDQRSEGFGLNDHGDVVGVSWTSNMGDTRAFLYTGGRMTNLGTLPNHYASHALGINNARHVVGHSAPPYKVVPEPRAFLYADGKMIDLNALLPKRSGWTLREANGINDHGQIVGAGERGGQRRAFLLSPNPRR